MLQGWVAKDWACSVVAANRAAQQVRARRCIEVSFDFGFDRDTRGVGWWFHGNWARRLRAGTV